MGSLSWLRIARRVPGLGHPPEYADLEALVETEADKTCDELHIARWMVPLATSLVGLCVFVPLTLFVEPWFVWGAVGLPTAGFLSGMGIHLFARQITPRQIAMRKKFRLLRNRLIRLRNILGLEPALSPAVGEVLNTAARFYQEATAPQPGADPRLETTVWTEARVKAQLAMEEGMLRLLDLAEPESVQAQESLLAQGWVMPMLEEMRAVSTALRSQRDLERASQPNRPDLAALAGLRDARSDLERLDQAASELEERA